MGAAIQGDPGLEDRDDAEKRQRLMEVVASFCQAEWQVVGG